MPLNILITACLYFFSLLFNVCFGQQPKLMLPIGHTGGVNSAQYSPDGKRLVTASGDNTAKIWDVVSGKIITDLKGHTKFVSSAQFSPDGTKIVTASGDKTAKKRPGY
jgi:WD40 repeat protein